MNTQFLKQNTHKRVKFPSYFKGKVSHSLMPNTDLKHWQTQTTKTSRNELWFSVLVRNLKTQQEMRQRFCFVSPTVAYIKGKSLSFIAKSITQKKDLIFPLLPLQHKPPRTPMHMRDWRSSTESSAGLGYAGCKGKQKLDCWFKVFQLLLYWRGKKKSKNIFPLLYLACSAAMVTTEGFGFNSFGGFFLLFDSLLNLFFLISLLKRLIILSGSSFLKQRKLSLRKFWRGDSCLAFFCTCSLLTLSHLLLPIPTAW